MYSLPGSVADAAERAPKIPTQCTRIRAQTLVLPSHCPTLSNLIPSFRIPSETTSHAIAAKSMAHSVVESPTKKRSRATSIQRGAQQSNDVETTRRDRLQRQRCGGKMSGSSRNRNVESCKNYDSRPHFCTTLQFSLSPCLLFVSPFLQSSPVTLAAVTKQQVEMLVDAGGAEVASTNQRSREVRAKPSTSRLLRTLKIPCRVIHECFCCRLLTYFF